MLHPKTSRFIFRFTAGLLFCLALSAPAQAQKAPDFTLQGEQNKTVSLKNLRGKVVYVDFWASWCGPCRKSFPWMNEMHDRYDSKDFQIVAINLDASHDDATAFLKKIPARFTIAYDPEGKVAEKYRVSAMPSSYLIDKKGNLVLVHKGYREGEAHKIEDKIRDLIKAR